VHIQSEDYRRVVFSGSGEVTTPDTIRSTQFTADLNGSGNARLKVDANELRLYLSGSGNIRAEGKSRDYHASIEGSGNIHADAVKTVNANVKITGSGNQSISVSDRLDARITGSGNIRYSGNPPTVNVNISGSGKVIKQ
uniref:GIN domain-containing protein n=1 Tax=Chitinophaga sp. TaxID=1869181 RepID=UPI00260E07C1